MLDHDGPLVPGYALQRHDVGQGLFGNNDARGVGTRVAGEPLYVGGGGEDLFRVLILPHALDDLARGTGGVAPGDVRAVLGPQHVPERGPYGLLGDELGELVRVRVGILVDPPGVPDGRLGTDGPERDDLGHVVDAAVLVGDVAHYLGAPGDREVYVH